MLKERTERTREERYMCEVLAHRHAILPLKKSKLLLYFTLLLAKIYNKGTEKGESRPPPGKNKRDAQRVSVSVQYAFFCVNVC